MYNEDVLGFKNLQIISFSGSPASEEYQHEGEGPVEESLSWGGNHKHQYSQNLELTILLENCFQV